MAAIKCNGLHVFGCEVTRPAYGRWFADLRVDSDEPITGQVTITTPGLTLVGTVVDELSGVDTNVAHLVVRGGANKITNTIEPRDYVAVTMRIIVEDLARDCGETLSSTIDSKLLDTPVPRWTRLRGAAGSELRSLLDTVLPGKRWRILEDGSLWMGEHAWSDSTFIYTLTETSPNEASKTIAVEKPYLNPGVTFDGDRVMEVVDNFNEPSVRQRYNTRKQESDRARDELSLRVEPIVQSMRLYPARVMQASTLGGPLEFKPDDERMPPMSKVPVKPGIPGVQVKIPKDARVRFMFENGDRQKPVVVSFDDGAVDEIAFAGGTKKVARVDDKVDGGRVIMTAVPPLGFKLDWLSPDGTTSAIGSFAVSGPGVGSVTVPGSASIECKIKEGADKIKA